MSKRRNIWERTMDLIWGEPPIIHPGNVPYTPPTPYKIEQVPRMHDLVVVYWFTMYYREWNIIETRVFRSYEDMAHALAEFAKEHKASEATAHYSSQQPIEWHARIDRWLTNPFEPHRQMQAAIEYLNSWHNPHTGIDFEWSKTAI